MKQYFNFALLFLLFASCEGETDYFYSISNKSTDTIYFQSDIDTDSNYQKGVLPPNHSTYLLVYEKMGGTETAQNILAFGNVKVWNSMGVFLKTDLSVDAAWTTYINRETRIPSYFIHHYILEVVDQDF